jgi:DNA integrity scanning protein DisA with diadenylate cyclase activity
MKRILNVYYNLKEVFGPNISIEVLDISNTSDVKHIVGDDIYETTKNRSHLSEEEIRKILRAKTGLNHIPWQLLEIRPIEMLESSFTVQDHTLVNLDQFSDFGRVIKFTYSSKQYLFIILSTLLDDAFNENIFRQYWVKVKDYLAGNNNNITREYLKTKIPSFLKNQFYIIEEVLTKISLSKIENKQLNSGLVFVNNYENFKTNYYADLFYDIDCKHSLREVDKIKQPFLEVVDGSISFLVIDKELNVKGLFFPDKSPKGLAIIETDNKKMMSDCLVVKIEGSNLVRVAVNNKMTYEIQSGFIRIRDYNALKNIFNGILDELNITECRDDFLSNIIDISYLKKGTIIVFGESVSDSKYTKGIRGEIKLKVLRDNDFIYRKTILTHLSKTDGAIFIDKNLRVYCFGAILKINNTETTTATGGGSRTHSARIFSAENHSVLVVKISEDGPISLFYKGDLKLEV